MKEKTVMILMETSDSTGETFYLDILYPTNSYFFLNLRLSPSPIICFSHFSIFIISHVKSCKLLGTEISSEL